MKIFFLFALFISRFALTVNGQNHQTDSLKQLLKTTLADSTRLKILMNVAQTYYFSKPDSCLFFNEAALALARKLQATNEEIMALNNSGEALRFMGDYPRALKMQMEALELNRKMKDPAGEASSLGFIGFTYVEFREYRQGLQYLLPALALSKNISGQLMQTFVLTNIGNAYDFLQMPDSALFYQRLAFDTYKGLQHGPLLSLILTRYGNAFARLGINDSALIYFHRSLQNANQYNDKVNSPKIQRKIAALYESSGQYDSSLYYARQSFINSQRSVQSLEIFESSNLLVTLFRHAKNPDSAFFYQDIVNTMADRLFGPKKFKELQLLMLEEQQRQQKTIREQEQFRNKIKYVILLSALSFFLLLAFILFKNNRQKQKANTILQQQKTKIEVAMTELKSTQSQLVQREKMASLGELTAGIAHEIQNPLNFINNFSEVNTELIEEMNQELQNGHLENAKIISNNIKENEQKINHHGKRAEAIVKGMLQHSRSSNGIKEPTDINALADEYFRLAYHGLRAKDKSFNATMKTGFDETIGKINIVPQDIGRVILNLITNAFYAVTEKKKGYHTPSPNDRDVPNGEKYTGLNEFDPLVTVSTKKINGTVEITVKDNGNGIPQNVLDKIFQPFFTTKPTGQGTGLGLSMSYDIITKLHGGELKVETKEGKGSQFIIILPT